MKKLVLACSAFLLILSACSSSSDSSSSSTDDDVLVSKTIETYANDGSTITTDYTYSGKKIVQETDDDGAYQKYTYTGNLITKIEYFDFDDVLEQREIFSYNSSSQLVSYVRLDIFDDGGNRDAFVYNANGTVSCTSYYGDLDSQDELQGTSIIYFENNEVSKVEEFSDLGTLTGTRLYTYDTKKNPFKNVIGLDKIQFVENEALGINHNIISDNYTNFGMLTTYNTTYTYNENNFPITDVDSDGDPTNNITTQYFY